MKMTEEIRKEVKIAKTTKDPQVLRKLLRREYWNLLANHCHISKLFGRTLAKSRRITKKTRKIACLTRISRRIHL